MGRLREPTRGDTMKAVRRPSGRWRMLYRDRGDAGGRLAEALHMYRERHPVVAALPRGGVPVGFEIARALGSELDAVVVRKVGAPQQPELALGAVGEDGVVVLDERLIARLGVDDATRDELVRWAERELDERLTSIRSVRPAARVKGRTVIVVDDGLATGSTMRAAIAVLRRRGARRIVVAVPVGAPDTVAGVALVADDVVCPATPTNFMSVGQWYADFSPVSEDTVLRLLGRSLQEDSDRIPTVSVATEYAVQVEVAGAQLPGQLAFVPGDTGTVVFAHGSGSSHRSPRNRGVAMALQEAGLSTLLFDLLTPSEAVDRRAVFDVERLGRRLLDATRWLAERPGLADSPVGWFGASTGAGAALWAAPDAGPELRAIVSRGGRPDLAGARLAHVRTPTLLIVGGDDEQVLALNRDAQRAISEPARLEVVPGATHLFEEPGAMEQVTKLARDWFVEHLT
jgi:predicted phosphoribosyltransferase/dienelactone hydrolase